MHCSRTVSPYHCNIRLLWWKLRHVKASGESKVEKFKLIMQHNVYIVQWHLWCTSVQKSYSKVLWHLFGKSETDSTGNEAKSHIASTASVFLEMQFVSLFTLATFHKYVEGNFLTVSYTLAVTQARVKVMWALGSRSEDVWGSIHSTGRV